MHSVLPEASPFLKRIRSLTPVSVQNVHKDAMATTAVRHVAPAAILQTRATLSTERVLVLLTTGKNHCVQVRHVCRVEKRTTTMIIKT